MYNFSKAQQFRWKGRLVSEKKYKLMLQRQMNGRATRKRSLDNEKSSKEAEDDKVNEDFPVQGERIIDIEFMARHLKCTACKEPLLLSNIKKEIRRGCKSIFHIQCHSCLLMNNVPTGKQSTDDNKRLTFDLNHKVAKGIKHAGITFHCFDKLCACLDIPSMSRNTFQYYDKKVGPSVKKVTHDLCDKEEKIEKKLTDKNIGEMEIV